MVFYYARCNPHHYSLITIRYFLYVTRYSG